MANSPRDDNRISASLAVGDDASADTEPLRVVTASGRLLLDIAGVATNGITGSWPTRDPRDDNRIPIVMAVTDDASEDITPLRIDSRNGLLFVDLLVE